MQAFFKATARTPPNHPRHRLTTSPSPPVSAGRGAKCGDEHHIPVEWQTPPPAWIAARRRRHVVEPSERLSVCVGVSSLILILLLLLALVVVAIVRGCSFILSSCIGTTLSTLHGHEQHSLTPLSTNEDNPNPKIVWLMSFPNSGTSFIIHMTREATNCTTATNYGLEGEIRDQPSVPAIQGPVGENGPWLELLPTKRTRIAETILTKTHCKGFCSGKICGPDKTFHTTRSFMMGCLTGNQGVLSSSNQGVHLVDRTYDKSLVQKAIHIFRHPLDNVVARFHLEYNEKRDAGDKKYMEKFPKGADGFRHWCELDDQNRGVLHSHFIDSRLRSLMLKIPCFNEFYRYTQWHNLAFETTRALNIPTMVLHYHEFSEDFGKARGRILEFLEMPLVGEGIEFDDGKEYHHYYTSEEKQAIRSFLVEFAVAETWSHLEGYDFGEDSISFVTTSV